MWLSRSLCIESPKEIQAMMRTCRSAAAVENVMMNIARSGIGLDRLCRC